MPSVMGNPSLLYVAPGLRARSMEQNPEQPLDTLLQS